MLCLTDAAPSLGYTYQNLTSNNTLKLFFLLNLKKSFILINKVFLNLNLVNQFIILPLFLK